MSSTRWSDDAFLDTLRHQSDVVADDCVRRLPDDRDLGRLFAQMDSNDAPLPTDVPAPVQEFFETTRGLPTLDGTPVDQGRLRRGEKVFMTHAFPGALTLLAYSLPQGYAAPTLTKVLHMTGNLEHHPYRRLLGVLQLLVNVSTVGGFERGGKAVVTAQKMRLLHAAIRRLVPKYLPDFEQTYGVPVNLEDMLGTSMGFSLLVVEGLQMLEVGLTDDEADDFYYIWRVFAQTVGIYPTGKPDASEYVPGNLTEAREFYASYRRRHYTDARRNPDGVSLARANVDMMNALLPKTPLRMLGMRLVPRIYMQILNGRDGMIRVGVKPVRGLFVTKWILRHLPKLWLLLWHEADAHLDRSAHPHENLSRIFFQRLINRSYGGEVTFLVPQDFADLRTLA